MIQGGAKSNNSHTGAVLLRCAKQLIPYRLYYRVAQRLGSLLADKILRCAQDDGASLTPVLVGLILIPDTLPIQLV